MKINTFKKHIEKINNQNIVILEGNFAAGSPNITSITYTGDKNLVLSEGQNLFKPYVSPIQGHKIR